MGTKTPVKLIVWSDRYSVGIARIDGQHQRLIDLINDLHAAMLAREGNTALGAILDGLATYTVSHFATEEGLMTKFAYPGFGEHKAEHDKLTAQVRTLQEKFRARKVALTLEVMTFLERWLTDHIANMDKKYSAQLRAAGVT
jgi:hemerythrin-like metal-binding protein